MRKEPEWQEGEGWRVVDAEGNVLQSGPPVIAEMTAGMGDPLQAAFGLTGEELQELMPSLKEN